MLPRRFISAVSCLALAGTLGACIAALPPPAAPARAAPSPTQAVATGNAGPAATFKGTVGGKVWFRGPACLQQATPPVCDGPYRQIEVWLYHRDRGWIGAVRTDNEGAYRAIVDPGTYTVVIATGYGGRWQSNVYVTANQVAIADLIVDFGAR